MIAHTWFPLRGADHAAPRKSGGGRGGTVGRWVLALVFTTGWLAAAPASAGSRLLLTPGRVAEVRAAAEQDAVLRELIAQQHEAAVQALEEPPPQFVNRDRPNVLREVRAFQRRLFDWMLAARLGEGGHDFVQRAVADLEAVVAWPNWGSASDTELADNHGLTVAEALCSVSLAYDWLCEVLTPAQRAAVLQAVREKGWDFFEPRMAGAQRAWFFEPAAANNWNAVVNGALAVSSAVFAEGDAERAARLRAFAVENVRAYVALYQPDGVYGEGPMYWNFGTHYLAFMVEALRLADGTDHGLLARPGLGQSGWYRMHLVGPTGRLFNFGDSREWADPSPVVGWLARETRDDALTALFHETLRTAVDQRRGQLKVAPGAPWTEVEARRFRPLEIVWWQPVVSPTEPAKMYLARGGDVELAVMRTAWFDPDAWFLGVKAGRNGLSHAHLDLGSFVLEAAGERWVIDLEPENYNVIDRVGWDRRDRLYRIGTAGHNTLQFGPAGQASEGEARIIEALWQTDRGRVQIDLTSAYAEVATRVLRTFEFESARGGLVIRDELVVAAQATPVRWTFHTRAEVIVQEGAVWLRQGQKVMAVTACTAARHAWRVSALPSAPDDGVNDAGISVVHLDVLPGEARALSLEVTFGLRAAGAGR